MKFKYWSLAVVAALASTAPPANSAALEGLRAHRAVYDLKLKEASDRSGITGMNGRIVYEMTGSACEGFAVRFRFLTRVQTPRKVMTNDQRTTSFESADGKLFTFVQQYYLNGQLEQDLRGKAERTDGITAVDLSKPEAQSVELGSSIFMTDHIVKIIEAAERKETIFTAKVYDASDEGLELVETTAIIGKEKADLTLDGENKELADSFKGEKGWPVSVSYFEDSGNDNSGEKMPVYQVSFLLHPSGISRDLVMQYQDYALKGDLKEVEYLKTEPCE